MILGLFALLTVQTSKARQGNIVQDQARRSVKSFPSITVCILQNLRFLKNMPIPTMEKTMAWICDLEFCTKQESDR